MLDQETLDEQARRGECVCLSLRKAARAVTQLFDGEVQSTGLRATQLMILGTLFNTGPVTVTGLAETLVMDRTTVTRNIRPIEKLGLLNVVPGRDRRSRVMSLTPQGERMVMAAFPLWCVSQSQVVEGLGEERWRELMDHLAALVALVR